MKAIRQHRGAAIVALIAVVVAILYRTGAMPDFPDVEKLI